MSSKTQRKKAARRARERAQETARHPVLLGFGVGLGFGFGAGPSPVPRPVPAFDFEAFLDNAPRPSPKLQDRGLDTVTHERHKFAPKPTVTGRAVRPGPRGPVDLQSEDWRPYVRLAPTPPPASKGKISRGGGTIRPDFSGMERIVAEADARRAAQGQDTARAEAAFLAIAREALYAEM